VAEKVLVTKVMSRLPSAESFKSVTVNEKISDVSAVVMVVIVIANETKKGKVYSYLTKPSEASS
jgi:hypothetical protein